MVLNRANSWAKRSYVSKDGSRFTATLIATETDAGAYRR